MTSLLSGAEALVQAQLARGPSGPMPTLWDSDGCEVAFHEAEGLLKLARPSWVQLHTWAPEAPAKLVRALLPGVGIVVGVGVDGIARQVALGLKSVSWGQEQMLMLARRAVACGAFALVFNAEGGWKRPPSGPEARRLAECITGGLALVAASCPGLRLWFTSYDHPSLHSTFPWRAWLGGESPIEVVLPQVYAAPAGGLMAHRGALPAREARALRSWEQAVRAGWFPGESLQGPSWRPYYQLHSVLCADTCASAVGHPFAALWALRSRSDEHGRAALLALCELHRRGFWGAGSIEAFQRGAGLQPDGAVGPRTLAALGIAAPGPAPALLPPPHK